MKKSLVALAVLGTFGAGAFAQSSVTLFGVVDLNAKYQNNGNTTLYSLGSDGINSSRFGFRGVEDLGGGMRGAFWLEAGMDNSNGTAGANVTSGPGATVSALFNRRSTLSLLGGFGEVRLGRDYTPTFWNLTTFDPFGTNGAGAYSNIHSTTYGAAAGGSPTTLVRANNSIGYFLPGNLGGIYGQAMVAAAEGPVNGNKYIGGRVGYQAGPVDVAVSYGQTYVVRQAAFQNDETHQFINVGGSYKFGNLTGMAQYGRMTLGDNTRTNYLVGGTFAMGPGTFKVSYSTYANNQSPADAKQIAAGYQYDLSRRTALYTNVSRITNEGPAVGGATFAAATAGGSLPAAAGKEYTALEIGVRHSF